MDVAVYELELCWFAKFWPSSAIKAHNAFRNSIFASFMNSYDIAFRPVPPRRDEKNNIKPRPRTIRSIFLGIKSLDLSVSDSIQVISAVSISNYLHGSDTLS